MASHADPRKYEALSKAKRKYSLVERFFSIILPGLVTIFIMFLISAEITCRFLFDYSILGSLELAESSMVVITFASLAGVQKAKAHVRMGLFVDKVSGKKRKPLIEALILIFMLVLCGILLFPFTLQFIRSIEIHETTMYLSFPIWVVTVFMPLGLFFLIFRLIIDLVTVGKELFR